MKAADRIVETILEHGEVWVVPYQHKIVRQLEARGLVVLTEERRNNPIRGGFERRVVAGVELLKARKRAWEGL